MTFPIPFLNPAAPALPGRARRLAMVLLLALAVPAQAQFSDKVVEEAKASTVMILAVDGKEISGSGTGFFISDQGHVATNFHVIDGSSEWLVVFTSGNRVRMEKSTLVASSPENDLAILKTRKFAEARVMTLATAVPSSAQKVMAIGFPGALEIPSTSPGLEDHPDGDLQGSRGAVAPFVPATFSGEVGRFQEEAELPIAGGTSVKADMIAHSAKISGGNSGGPLIDVEGRAAGIIFALGSDDSGTVPYAYAIHSSHLVDLARRHRVPFRSSAARATPPGGGSALQTLLIAALGALAVVSFLVTLKKPREAIVGGISRLRVHGTRGPASPQKSPEPRKVPRTPDQPAALSSSGGRMVLRGRGPDGQSFHVAFGPEGFLNSRGKLVLGRNRDLCQLHIPHDSVSRQHAMLSLQGGTVLIEDRNSGNGTSVNERMLSLGAPPVALRSGDRIRLGEVELVYDLIT